LASRQGDALHFGLAPRKPFSGKEAAEKLLSECVILSKAKDLLFARAEEKADPSIAENRRDRRITPYGLFSGL